VDGTIRDNVLLANPGCSEARYEAALAACALGDDLRAWPLGDATRVGEKGVSISGGQKRRLVLARALCSDARVLLLDSPLAGLDPPVAKHVLTRAIAPLAAGGRVVVMTSHSPRALPLANRVVVLGRGGTLDFDGSWEALQWPGLAPAAATDREEVAAGGDDASSQNGDGKKNKEKQVVVEAPEGGGTRGALLAYASASGRLSLALAVGLSVAACSGSLPVSLELHLTSSTFFQWRRSRISCWRPGRTARSPPPPACAATRWPPSALWSSTPRASGSTAARA
jgi:energy-coupling factor transporter ATP-binding protein EcfA2